MPNTSQLALIYEMIDSAESNIQAAKNLLNEINGENFSTKKYKDKASHLTPPVISSSVTGRVVEGVFDGQNMMGSDQKSYPVPANYASKSKLIPGDHLKLTIKENGAFIYKQIGPIERKRVIGKLTYDDGQYKVVVGANIYNVLLASVTYFKVQVGQNVTVIVPAEGDSEWSAIENSMDSPDVEAAIKEVEKNDEDTTFDISQTKVTE